jgi:hypothetical protein
MKLLRIWVTLQPPLVGVQRLERQFPKELANIKYGLITHSHQMGKKCHLETVGLCFLGQYEQSQPESYRFLACKMGVMCVFLASHFK